MISLKVSFLLISLVVSIYCNVLPEETFSPDDNGTRLIVGGDYVPRGRIINIGNLPVYEAIDNLNSNRMLIVIHDIFGFSSSNLRQITDVMALQSSGYRAVMPDFFRGEGWDRTQPVDPNNHPPALTQFLLRVGDWESIIRPDIINVLRFYQSQGVQHFAILGLCWGGRIATLSASELHDEFIASAFVHPLQVTNAMAPAVRLPMFLMASQDEPDLYQFYQTIRASFGDNSGNLRFNIFHGFAATIGNFNDPVNLMHVNEVVSNLGVFYDRNL